MAAAQPTASVYDDGPPPELYYVSLNDTKSTTIVLLHGLMSSHREWAQISQHLSDYHLLIPDLPGHRDSKHCGPYSLSNASNLVANLVRNHARDSTCHLVGFSGGGFIAVELAHKHPELVQGLVVSGVYNMASKRRLLSVAPYFAVPIQTLQSALPLSVSSYIAGFDLPPTLLEDTKINNSFQLTKDGFAALLDMSEGYPLQCRALAVAGAKHDLVDETAKLAEVFRQGNVASRAVQIIDGKHGWGLEKPQLFADAVKAWLDNKPLPEEFRPLP